MSREEDLKKKGLSLSEAIRYDRVTNASTPYWIKTAQTEKKHKK